MTRPPSRGKLRLLAESPLPRAWRPKIVGKSKRELRLANGSAIAP